MLDTKISNTFSRNSPNSSRRKSNRDFSYVPYSLCSLRSSCQIFFFLLSLSFLSHISLSRVVSLGDFAMLATVYSFIVEAARKQFSFRRTWLPSILSDNIIAYFIRRALLSLVLHALSIYI